VKSCSVGPAVRGTARFVADALEPRNAYVSYQIAQHGWWAGIAFDGRDTIRYVEQRPGHRPRVVSAQNDAGGGPLGGAAVGIRHEAVVANVFDHGDVGDYSSHAHVFSPGGSRRLRGLPGWPSTAALSVTDGGTIVGDVKRGPRSPRTRVVEWATPRSRPQRQPGAAA
jgi:hypothetical protein